MSEESEGSNIPYVGPFQSHQIPPLDYYQMKEGTGNDYEIIYMAYLILKLMDTKKVENFYLSSNNEEYGLFDDVVVEIKFKNQTEWFTYALQLKHKENNTITMGTLESTSTKENFYYKKCTTDFEKSKNVKRILFTTAKLNQSKTDFQINFDDKTMNLTLITESELVDLITTKDENEEKTSYHCDSDVFENFYFCTEEKNLDKLKEKTINMFKERVHGREENFSTYLELMNNWTQNRLNIKKINKKWITKKLSLCALLPFIKPLRFCHDKVVDDKKKILRDAITKFDRVRCNKNSYNKLKDCWLDTLKGIGNRINKMNAKYSITVGKIEHQQINTEHKDINQLAWLLKKSPLVLKGCPQVYKLLKFWDIKNIIVIDDNNDINESLFSFQKLSDLNSLKSIYENIINNFTYSIETQKQETLRNLMDLNEELKNKITIDDLVNMTSDPLIIGNHQYELPTCHIQRNLTKIFIDPQYLQHVDKNTIIVVTGIEEIKWLRDKKVNENDCNIMYTTTNESIDDSHLDPTKCVHFLKYVDKNRLEWIRSISNKVDEMDVASIGPISELKKFQLTDDCSTVQESELFSIYENDINIVCANPGMGKSTLVKSLKRNSSSYLWTVVIQARNYAQYLKQQEISAEEFLKSIVTERFDERAKAIFDSFLNQRKIRIIWDGLDEVSDQNLSKVLWLIENIKSKLVIKQWLTSRRNLSTLLETKFYTFSRNLTQFDRQQQERYIIERLQYCEKDLNEVLDKIMENLQKFLMNTILGIPLQIYMLTEILLHRKKRTKLLHEGFTVLHLYQYFVDEKFKLYFRDKQQIDMTIQQIDKECIAEKQRTVGFYKQISYNIYFQSSFKKFIYKLFDSKTKNFIEEIMKNKDEVGFIINVSDMNEAEFAHNSYSEYFAALYLFENAPEIVLETSFICNEKLNNIRLFLDLMLVKNSKPFIAILCKNFKILEECSDDELDQKDSINRDVLHVSCSWNQVYSNLQFEGKNEFQYNLRITVNDNRRVQEYKDKKKIFVELHKTDINKKKLLLFFPFLIPFYDKDKNDFNCEYLPAILYCALKLDNTLLFDCIKESQSLSPALDRIVASSLFLLGLTFESREVLKAIMLDEKYQKIFLYVTDPVMEMLTAQTEEMFKYLINLKSRDGKMPLHYACIKSSSNIVIFLIKIGSLVNAKCNNNKLPLHYACEENDVESVKLLLIADSSVINSRDKDGMCPIHYACLKKKSDIVKCLLKENSSVNLKCNNNKLPLHYACETCDSKSVQLLAKADSSLVNEKDKYGMCPIHYACLRRNSETVKWLVNYNSDVNVKCSNNKLPLHYVCENVDVQTATVLVTNSSEINHRDSSGMLPIHYACEHSDFETVRLLVQYKSEINLPDRKNLLPIHYACKNYELESVKFLLQEGSRFDVPDDNNLLPIHYACKENDWETVRLLIDKGSKINVPDQHNLLPIHYASKGNALAIIDLLVQNNSELNTHD